MSNVQILIVSQSLLVPLLLSMVLFYRPVTLLWFQSAGLFLAWIFVYLWIRGGVPLIPDEALDWLWVITLLITLASLSRTQVRCAVLSSIIFIGGLIAYSWPVLREQISLLLVVEIILFSIAALLLLSRTTVHQPVKPALLMSINIGMLAVTVGLAGSLLIAQLAGAVAALLGVLVVRELTGHARKVQLNVSQWRMLITLYLGFLFISLIYVELHIVPTLLLLISPLLGVFAVSKYGWLINMLMGKMAMLWVLMRTSQTGY